ncbi:MAG: EamA family transporter [Promethearchaeota archaeon]
MTIVFFIILGLCLGLLNTCQLHLAKAMERHGIEIFSRDKTFKEKNKKPLIYIVGLVLNNTLFIYTFTGLMFTSAAVFNSVFGMGLIVLMLYSHFILKEEIKKPEKIGAILIIIGTLLVGILYITEPITAEEFNYTNFYIFMLILAIVFSALLIFSHKTRIAIAFIFGAIAGAFGGLDSALKRVGFKNLGFLDAFLGVFRLEILSIIFLMSFLVGSLAFLLTQIGFAKGADASKLVPMFNSFCMITPIVFEFFIYGAIISFGKILGISIIIVGIFLMNIFKNLKELQLENLNESVIEKEDKKSEKDDYSAGVSSS